MKLKKTHTRKIEGEGELLFLIEIRALPPIVDGLQFAQIQYFMKHTRNLRLRYHIFRASVLSAIKVLDYSGSIVIIGLSFIFHSWLWCIGGLIAVGINMFNKSKKQGV